MDLKNLSIEELENLRSEIDSLIEEKSATKYKKDDHFVNPKDFSFGYIIGVIDTEYEIVTNSYDNLSTNRVSEQYLDDCIFISQENYEELVDSKKALINNLCEFRSKKYKEIRNFAESLGIKFQDIVQKLINKCKND